jgi:uncharacterized protein (TIGR03083 family)
MDVITALDQTWTSIRELFRSLETDEWERPTACSEWRVRDMAAHLAAVEGGFLGFEQPSPPEGWTTTHTGVDAWTAQGVAARRDWGTDQLVDEVDRVAGTRLAQLRSLDDDGWKERTAGPLGETTMRGLAEIRLLDVYIHLLDMRSGLGWELGIEGEPEALEGCVQRAVQLSPWGAAKKAGLGDGTRIRLHLYGPSAATADVVVDGGRGSLAEPEGEIDDTVEGPAAAYLLLVTGREELVEDAGGICAMGEAATALFDHYRFFN